ncbi:molybdopterin synthase catalytic subunit [Arthrobacter stackebrandtii]|uniref:Molybdopterin synthase catalytic subunit n=1 Tax=Arthrobacter stackebrandtii TaxID=272161 RepID=A0ABS4YR60_9MICC|nr:molybdenum cofactor biosynthesis protein MoaE [Arthrobacter stackebrandtii]MBP2411281.1 molybdopterin synthase catalytic subunit [Arthrobacter stackebrandtii]PYH00113.1 molybdenum cofactor biosynthesis protein MoaE [Arthrobacter stackebrandtii]
MDTNVEIVAALLSAEPISVDAAIAAVESSTAGAVVTFSGVVRNHDGGASVERLAYSAHPLAKKVLAEVAASLANLVKDPDGHPVRVWVAHRVGPLEIGEPALVAAVASSHRAEAFELCSELVERIKAQVPIWKEQFFSDGTVEWVGAGELPEPQQ